MAELLFSLNVWAILVAAVVYFIIGALWYSVLFANTWMKLRGVTEEDIGEPDKLIFLWTFLLQLVAVGALATFLQAMELDTFWHGAMMGFGTGVGIVYTLTGTTSLFSDTKFALHAIDNGYHVVGLTVAGAILGAW